MASKPILIAVDTGNHSIKTPNTVFRASLTEYDGALGGDCLVYDGKSYSICDRKMSHEDNKANNDYKILVMIAMAKELLEKYKKRDMTPPQIITKDVILCMGLPPQHLKKYKSEYESFFSGNYEFSFAGQSFRIRVAEVYVFPQCLAAAQSQFGEILSAGDSLYLIDIGGYTTDIIHLLRRGGEMTMDTNCIKTVNKGALRVYNAIINQVETEHDFSIPVSDLDRYFQSKRVIQKKDPLWSLYDRIAQDYVSEMLTGFLDNDVALNSGVPVFLCGGALAFQPYIQAFFKARPHRYAPLFLGDVHANAKGYLKLGMDKLESQKRKA